jgi:hypothetical protein
MKENTFVSFRTAHKSLRAVLTDHNLASLGDAYVNFIYSLTLSNKNGKPSGTKVKGSTLAEALRKAGLREFLPARMSRHELADAAEALTVYGWLQNCVTLNQSVTILQQNEDAINGFTRLLETIKNKLKLS